MKRFAACFALFGFFASLVIGLLGDATLSTSLERAFIWSAAFAAIGALAGWAGCMLIAEVQLPPAVSAGKTPEDERASEQRAIELEEALIAREREKTNELVERRNKTADKVESR